MKLGDKLIKLRKEKGLTQADVAEKLDVSRQSISNWEAGTVVPTTKRLKDLSLLYGVSLDHLLNEGNYDNEENGSSSNSQKPKNAEKPDPEKLREKQKTLWIAGAIVIASIIIAIAVVVANIFKDGQSKEKPGFLNEWNYEDVPPKTEGEFDFS